MYGSSEYTGIASVRNNGAIGKFYERWFKVSARSYSDARRAIMSEAHIQGFEVNYVAQVDRA